MRALEAREVPEGQGRGIELQGQAIAIFKSDGKFYALEDRCSHAGAVLNDGAVKEGCVECLLHGARFDLATGRPMSLPATRPVKTYPVRVVDGKVEVRL